MMTLNNYVFEMNPSEMTVIQPARTISFVQTYDSIAVFSWGVSIVGKAIGLKWDWLSVSQFDQLQSILEGDEQVSFFPEIDSGTTYMVEVLGLDGKYHMSQGGSGNYRTEVFLKLLIIS